MTVWIIWFEIPKLEAKEILGIYTSEARAVEDIKEYQKKFPLTALKFIIRAYEVKDGPIERTTTN